MATTPFEKEAKDVMAKLEKHLPELKSLTSKRGDAGPSSYRDINTKSDYNPKIRQQLEIEEQSRREGEGCLLNIIPAFTETEAKKLAEYLKTEYKKMNPKTKLPEDLISVRASHAHAGMRGRISAMPSPDGPKYRLSINLRLLHSYVSPRTPSIYDMAMKAINDIEQKQNWRTNSTRKDAVLKIKRILSDHHSSTDELIIQAFKDQMAYMKRTSAFGPRGESGSTFFKVANAFIKEAETAIAARKPVKILSERKIEKKPDERESTEYQSSPRPGGRH